jgi:hypothetical protein
MIVYNQAFDLYHTIFRFLQFLNRFENGTEIEIERLRIWDFYLLFPNRIHEIRLKQNESDIRKIRNSFVKDSNNPYEKSPKIERSLKK